MRVFVAALCLAQCASGDPFLSSWMGRLMPVIGNFTLLDLSLPGSHDTMTYDLSTVVSMGGDDGHDELSELMHELSFLVPGDFIRRQAQTQALTITQQLDVGLRFIDFRVMYTSAEGKWDWYCLHFVQSNRKAIEYLTEIRDWLVAHPTEIVVLAMSKHGSFDAVGDDQYNNVTTQEKQRFWLQVETLFQGLLLDTAQSTINTTTVADLVARSHRLVLFAADFDVFTGGTTLALDSKRIDNWLGSSVYEEENAFQQEITTYANMQATLAAHKASGTFLLMSLSSSGSTKLIEDVLELDDWPFDKEKIRARCSTLFALPDVTRLCPPTLLDLSQLTNYYKQIALEAAVQNPGWSFPNAFYIDGIDVNGTIRTGATKLAPIPGPVHGNSSGIGGDSGDAKYALVDSMLLVTLRRLCAQVPSPSCAPLMATLELRRASSPLQRWEDWDNGRVTGWPTPNTTVVNNILHSNNKNNNMTRTRK